MYLSLSCFLATMYPTSSHICIVFGCSESSSASASGVVSPVTLMPSVCATALTVLRIAPLPVLGLPTSIKYSVAGG